MDYSTLLTDDQKRDLLNQRIQQFAAEAYQHSLNLKVAELTGDTNAVDYATASIANLDQALQVHTEELASLSEPATPPAQ
jgi:hypothetical protein